MAETPMVYIAPKRNTCIYCSGPLVNIGRGEHVVQEAIGGRVTIKTVCGTCNNQFSGLDKELCSRSYLAAMASQELGTRVWQVWDVDHAAQNLLVEANPDWNRKGFRSYPQVIIEPTRIMMRSDYEDLQRFGSLEVPKILDAAITTAFRKCRAGAKGWIHSERITFDAESAFDSQYRFPPRMFFPYDMTELARRLSSRKKASFTLRFQSQRDFGLAVDTLKNWSYLPNGKDFQVAESSFEPPFRFFFNAGTVLRALQKTSVNLLALCCPNTPVDREHFGFIIDRVVGRIPISSLDIRNCGFVRARDVRSISRPGAHCFRLCHSRGEWLVISSFFGGKIGSAVRFPGQNNESWTMLDVTAPLKSSRWTMSPSSLSIPGHLKIEWNDGAEIMPSAGIRNGVATTRIVPL